MDRRLFLTGAGLIAGASLAARPGLPRAAAATAAFDPNAALRAANVPNRTARITRLFKTPDGYPNALRASPEGLWVAEQRTLTEPASGKTNMVYLVDWDGRVLRRMPNDCHNTSGMGYGGGSVWLANNADPQGIMRYDAATGRLQSHRQIPLGLPNNGGGCHGVMYHEGKVYITALRLRGIMRVDAETWQPEFMIPYNWPRVHEVEWENGSIWMVTGTLNGPSPEDDRAGLARYDAATGRLVETVTFENSDFDPHGITLHQGKLYTCDAGIHPGWPDQKSPGSGYVGRIDFI